MKAEDRQEILDLISGYSHTWDSLDVDGFVALFQDDAVHEIYGPEKGSPVISTNSNAERQTVVMARLAMFKRKGIQPRHYQTNTVLTEIAEGLVRGRTIGLGFWQRSGEPAPELRHTVVFEDEFRKTADGWKFARRNEWVDNKVDT